MENVVTPNHQAEPSQQQQPLAKSPSIFSKYKKFIALAILFIILIGIGLFLASANKSLNTSNKLSPIPKPIAKPSPTPISTANWQTYTNPQYGFSIQYPQGYQISESTYANFGVFLLSMTNYLDDSVPFSQTDKIRVDLYVSQKQNTDNPLYFQCCAYGWVEKSYNYLKDTANGEQINGLEKIDSADLAGMKAQIFKVSKENASVALGSPAYFVAFLRGNTGHLANATSGQGELIFSKPNIDLVNKILSTFKLIDTNTQSNNVSSYKTYSNTKYNFSLNIPASWEVVEQPDYYTNKAVLMGPMTDINNRGQQVTPYVAQELWLDVVARTSDITSLQDAQNKVYQCKQDANNTSLQTSKIVINNKELLLIKNSACGDHPTDLLIWLDDKSVFLLKTYKDMNTFTYSITFSDTTKTPTQQNN